MALHAHVIGSRHPAQAPLTGLPPLIRRATPPPPRRIPSIHHTRGHVAGKEDYTIYMGRDKYENEELIKHGLPTDVWCAAHGGGPPFFARPRTRPALQAAGQDGGEAAAATNTQQQTPPNPSPSKPSLTILKKKQVPRRRPLVGARLPAPARGRDARRHPGRHARGLLPARQGQLDPG